MLFIVSQWPFCCVKMMLLLPNPQVIYSFMSADLVVCLLVLFCSMLGRNALSFCLDRDFDKCANMQQIVLQEFPFVLRF